MKKLFVLILMVAIALTGCKAKSSSNSSKKTADKFTKTEARRALLDIEDLPKGWTESESDEPDSEGDSGEDSEEDDDEEGFDFCGAITDGGDDGSFGDQVEVSFQRSELGPLFFEMIMVAGSEAEAKIAMRFLKNALKEECSWDETASGQTVKFTVSEGEERAEFGDDQLVMNMAGESDLFGLAGDFVIVRHGSVICMSGTFEIQLPGVEAGTITTEEADEVIETANDKVADAIEANQAA